MRYRIDQEQLSEFLRRQARLVERLPVEAAEAAADGYSDGLDDSEREAVWLAAGIATFIGQAIADEPERFIVAAARARRRIAKGEGEMTTMETTSYRIEDARSPLWFGGWPSGWGDVVRGLRSRAGALGGSDDRCRRSRLDGRAASARSRARRRDDDGPRGCRCRASSRTSAATRGTVLGVVGEGYEPLQNRAAFAFCDAITDCGEAHWLGAGETRGGARVHALMQLDREIRIGDAEGEDVLPLLCFRNGHDGGLAVTISVAPFRLACLNGMMLPLDGAARMWKARHTANLDARLVDARRTLGIAWRYYDELEEIGGRLIREPISGSRVRALPRRARSAARAAPRSDERRPRRAQRRARARGDRDRLHGNPRPREHHRHPLGRIAGGGRVRRPHTADPRHSRAAATTRRASSARPSRPR